MSGAWNVSDFACGLQRPSGAWHGGIASWMQRGVPVPSVRRDDYVGGTNYEGTRTVSRAKRKREVRSGSEMLFTVGQC